MFFSQKKNLNKHKLILDLGNSGIRLVVASPGKSGYMKAKRVFGSENIVMPKVDFRGLWRKIFSFSVRALEDFKSMGIKADEAQVVFSSPWYFSRTHLVKKNYDFPVAITQKYIREIFTSEENNLKKEVSSKFILSESDLDTLRLYIMSARLNGYPVKGPLENLFDKSVKDFSAYVYAQVLFGEAVSRIKTLFEDFGVGRIEFQTVPWVIFDTLIREGNEDVLVIDIGGEITEMIEIADGRIQKINSFGRGFNYAVRKSAPLLNAGLEDAEDLLKNYMEGKLEGNLEEILSPVLKETSKEWHNLLMETMKKQNFSRFTPKKTIVTGPPEADWLSWSLEQGFQKRDLMKIYLSYINAAK